jgi:hypothetical protein
MGLYSLLGDPTFFQQVPAFDFLEEEGQEAHRKVVESVLKESEEGCSTCGGVQSILRPVMHKFALKAAELSEKRPEELDPLADYITSKRGYRPNPIVLYYKRVGDRTIKLSF